MLDTYRNPSRVPMEGNKIFLKAVRKRLRVAGWTWVRLSIRRVLFDPSLKRCPGCGMFPRDVKDAEGLPVMANIDGDGNPIKTDFSASCLCSCWQSGMTGYARNHLVLRLLEHQEGAQRPADRGPRGAPKAGMGLVEF